MSQTKIMIGIFFILGMVLNSHPGQTNVTKLKGPYLGQTPPGKTAVMFAPGKLTAGGNETNITFSADGKEFVMSLSTRAFRFLAEPRGVFLKGYMMFSRVENGCWAVPREFSFAPKRKSGYPFLSPDGKRLYFNSNRTASDPWDKADSGIWYVERKNSGWREPVEVKFPEGYRGGKGVYPTAAANGSLYFACWPTREKGIIHVSRYRNGRYGMPEPLSGAINDGGGNHPYIAPDESYLIFDGYRENDNIGELDLYISFRNENGQWTKVQNLGNKINSPYSERRPFVSFDGKYLFFSSDRVSGELPEGPMTLPELQRLTSVPANGYQHLYWVDAGVIEDLKPEE